MKNSEVINSAQAVLRESPYHALHQITCCIENGTLVLIGTLPSFHQKQVALHALTGKVNGTPICITRLKVEYPKVVTENLKKWV